MRVVSEVQKYWDYKSWQEIFAWYYKPLINNNIILNFECSIEDNEEGLLIVAVKYTDTRELGDDLGQRSLPRSEPKQLPPHIKVDNIVTLTADTINDVLDIINHFEEYWPGVWIENLSISQIKDNDAVGILTLTNYEADIEEEELDEGDLRYE